MFGGLGKIMGGAGLSPGIIEALSKISVSDNRKAFIAILIATASSAGSKPNFNLDLEMNDLWTRLQNLKSTSGGSSGGGLGGMLSGALGPLQNILTSAIKVVGEDVKR